MVVLVLFKTSVVFYVLLFSLRCFVLTVKVCLKCVKFDVCFSVSGNLLISNVKPQHNGVYICRASTPGTRNYTNAAANLTVLGGYNYLGYISFLHNRISLFSR